MSGESLEGFKQQQDRPIITGQKKKKKKPMRPWTKVMAVKLENTGWFPEVDMVRDSMKE